MLNLFQIQAQPEQISCFNVQFQKIYMPTPWKVNGNSEGVGVSEAKILKGKYGLYWKFQRGGGFKTENLPWEGYGYFLEQHNRTTSHIKAS